MGSTPLDEIIGDIKHHRVVQKLSQLEIAKRMGNNVTFVQALETRTGVDRRWGTVIRYAEAVGVELEVDVIR